MRRIGLKYVADGQWPVHLGPDTLESLEVESLELVQVFLPPVQLVGAKTALEYNLAECDTLARGCQGFTMSQPRMRILVGFPLTVRDGQISSEAV